MQSFTVSRTFHPIGQGAFYTEILAVGKKIFTVVYDCGANNSNNPPKTLVSEVKNSFPEDQYDNDGKVKIDILFLSHYHNDHINGLSLLNPKYVVCPYISDDEILMFETLNTSEKVWNTQAMRNPSAFFGSTTTIVRVNETDSEESYQRTYNEIEPLDIERISNDIGSGTIIDTGLKGKEGKINWCYIPYNYHYRWWLTDFKNKLSSEKLDFDKLKADPTNYIDSNKAEIRKICDVFKEKTNGQSLILYSGPYVDLKSAVILESSANLWNYNRLIKAMRNYGIDSIYQLREICDHLLNKNWKYTGYPYSILYRNRIHHPAVIYFGDITIKEILIQSLTRILSSVMKFVGTIQVPHHGSDRSFDSCILYNYANMKKELYPDYSLLYVICAGKNSKSHPGRNTVATLTKSNQHHAVVKDVVSTAISETWEIE